MNDLQEHFIESRVFDEIATGDTASNIRTVSQRDIDLLAETTGDMTPAQIAPAHVAPVSAAGDMFHHVMIRGMCGSGLSSELLGQQQPRPGTIYPSQQLHGRAPVSVSYIAFFLCQPQGAGTPMASCALGVLMARARQQTAAQPT